MLEHSRVQTKKQERDKFNKQQKNRHYQILKRNYDMDKEMKKSNRKLELDEGKTFIQNPHIQHHDKQGLKNNHMSLSRSGKKMVNNTMTVNNRKEQPYWSKVDEKPQSQVLVHKRKQNNALRAALDGQCKQK